MLSTEPALTPPSQHIRRPTTFSLTPTPTHHSKRKCVSKSEVKCQRTQKANRTLTADIGATQLFAVKFILAVIMMRVFPVQENCALSRSTKCACRSLVSIAWVEFQVTCLSIPKRLTMLSSRLLFCFANDFTRLWTFLTWVLSVLTTLLLR